MVAIVVEKPHALAVADDRPATPGQGEILVAVERAGICGSDMHILHGANPFATYPRIIGHEFAGHVAAAGNESGFAVGERVVIDPVTSCGRCHPCRTGRHNVCARLQVFGVHRDGGFRSRIVVPAANAVRIPSGMTADIAALAEPFSIAANVLLRTGCNADDVVMIYGAGTVGITVLQVAKLHGARCIIADLDEARLERAAAFGADVTLNPRRVSVPEAVASELDGLGPSVVIDGAGVPTLFAEMCRLAAPAGRIGLLGFSEEPTPMIQKDIVGKELSIVGSRLNRGLLPQVVEWLASGKLRGAALITQTFAAKDARAAFDLIEQHPDRTIKVQLAFD
jgi:L-gulonate 5-dehydrogenase